VRRWSYFFCFNYFPFFKLNVLKFKATKILNSSIDYIFFIWYFRYTIFILGSKLENFHSWIRGISCMFVLIFNMDLHLIDTFVFASKIKFKIAKGFEPNRQNKFQNSLNALRGRFDISKNVDVKQSLIQLHKDKHNKFIKVPFNKNHSNMLHCYWFYCISTILCSVSFTSLTKLKAYFPYYFFNTSERSVSLYSYLLFYLGNS